MRLDTAVERTGDVTLVAVRVRNTCEHAQRVRIANMLDGCVYPPRIGGRPAPGWDDGGYEGVFEAGEIRSLGYATPAPPPDSDTHPPVEVAWTEAAPDGPRDDPPTPGRIVSNLGDPRPPRDALPDADDSAAIPSAVADWLERVEHRIADESATPADRETLDRVVARATDISRMGWPR